MLWLASIVSVLKQRQVVSYLNFIPEIQIMPILPRHYLNLYFHSLTVIVLIKRQNSLGPLQYLVNRTKHAISESFYELRPTLLAFPRRLKGSFEFPRSSIPLPYVQQHH